METATKGTSTKHKRKPKAKPTLARVNALWKKPVLSDTEIPDAVGLASSTWHVLKARGDCPQLFRIGRRVFVRTSDLHAWINGKAERAAA